MIKIEVEKNGGTFGYFFEDSVWEQIVDGELVWPKKFVRYNTAFELGRWFRSYRRRVLRFDCR